MFQAPVMLALKSYSIGWSFQKLSSLFLKLFMLFDSTTHRGRLLHNCTTLILKNLCLVAFVPSVDIVVDCVHDPAVFLYYAPSMLKI